MLLRLRQGAGTRYGVCRRQKSYARSGSSRAAARPVNAATSSRARPTFAKVERSRSMPWRQRSAPGDQAASESRGGISPRRAPRTLREPLSSYGSQCSALTVQKRQWAKRSGDERITPASQSRVPFGRCRTLELASCLLAKKDVDPTQGRLQRRFVEVAVVVDPAADIRVEHPHQVVQRVVAPRLESPSLDRLTDRFHGLGTSCRENDTPYSPPRRFANRGRNV